MPFLSIVLALRLLAGQLGASDQLGCWQKSVVLGPYGVKTVWVNTCDPAYGVPYRWVAPPRRLPTYRHPYGVPPWQMLPGE